MEIERVTGEDLEAVTRLVSAVSQVDVLPLLNAQGQQEYQQRVLPDLATTFDGENFVSIKATRSGEIIGFAALRNGNYLTHLFVDQSAQGTGVGRDLLGYVLQTTDASEISLRSSLNAVDFYRHHGFVASGEESQFNGIRFVPMCLIRGE